MHNVGLMQDRATLRRSSRHMTKMVDQRNAGDPLFQRNAANPQCAAFEAASDLAFEGADAAQHTRSRCCMRGA